MNLSSLELDRLHEQQRAVAALAVSTESKPTVLIVDDSLSVRRSLAQFVADLGMDSRTARDGFEAIHAIGQQQPTLILVDLEMPRMNGLELTAHVRANEITRVAGHHDHLPGHR